MLYKEYYDYMGDDNRIKTVTVPLYEWLMTIRDTENIWDNLLFLIVEKHFDYITGELEFQAGDMYEINEGEDTNHLEIFLLPSEVEELYKDLQTTSENKYTVVKNRVREWLREFIEDEFNYNAIDPSQPVSLSNVKKEKVSTVDHSKKRYFNKEIRLDGRPLKEREEEDHIDRTKFTIDEVEEVIETTKSLFDPVFEEINRFAEISYDIVTGEYDKLFKRFNNSIELVIYTYRDVFHDCFLDIMTKKEYEKSKNEPLTHEEDPITIVTIRKPPTKTWKETVLEYTLQMASTRVKGVNYYYKAEDEDEWSDYE